MTTSEFERVIQDRCDKIRAQLGVKGTEYARGDRLSNFKAAGAAMRCAPEKALLGFMMKHVISICDFVNDLDDGRRNEPFLWQEKIGDAINYLVLLDAMRQEAEGLGA